MQDPASVQAGPPQPGGSPHAKEGEEEPFASPQESEGKGLAPEAEEEQPSGDGGGQRFVVQARENTLVKFVVYETKPVRRRVCFFFCPHRSDVRLFGDPHRNPYAAALLPRGQQSTKDVLQGPQD